MVVGESTFSSKHYRLAVLVAALGYFVDIYDLLLFSIVRVPSLRGIQVPESDLLNSGVLLINTQMIGLLLGGILWGLLGDRKGRLSVLFGSIFLYSLANILNGFAQTLEQYAVLRFLAGLGLAGELGAGITLVTESMPRHLRGYGTSIVAGIGLLGAVVAALIGDFFSWRTAFFIGGGMGLALLLLRLGVQESGLFQQLAKTETPRGRWQLLFSSKVALRKYLCVILIGVPIWYVIGILVTFSPEFGRDFGMTDIPSAGKAVMYSYLGLSVGDLLSGFLCQWLGSRKKVLRGFILMLGALIAVYFLSAGRSLFIYYVMCGLLGFASGYWAMFVTVAAEQFGTNIRSTVTTTVPNFVRGAVVFLTMGFQFFKGSLGVTGSGIAVGAIVLVIALIALHGLEETFHKDLAYFDT